MPKSLSKDTPDKDVPGGPIEEVITTHVNADFDALSSMLAASKLYPDAAMVFPGSKESNLRDFFLHSASYLFDFSKVKQIEFDRVRRLILVDTRQKGRIGKFSELVGKEGLEIHIYDHHPDSPDDIRGHKEVIRRIGSTTALLTGILREKGIPVSPDEASIMCLGIHEDTGSFTFSSTTSEDYEAAAWLTSLGADHNIISDMLTRELTAEQLWLLNDLTRAATRHVYQGVEVVISKVIRDQYIGDFAMLVHKFMEMENLNVVFAMAQMENRIYLVARSRIDEVNAAEIALALGGGGHPHAASATIRNRTLPQVERSLDALLSSRIQPGKTAGDMMSSPVIHIGPEEPVGMAASLMTRYNINVLLVMDGGVLQGYITRQVVEKACFFRLDSLKVREYMNIEYTTVAPDAPLKDVQDFIIRNRLRILPVLDGAKVVGVITRTDLLNILLGAPLVPEYLYDSKNAGHLLRKKNLAGLLKERLPRSVIQTLKHMGQVADMVGYNAYIVGGVVRDLVLKRENLDVDVVIEGDGIHFAQEFAKLYPARVRTHHKFGTAVLIFPNGFKVDVATARMEYYESPGSPPIVEMSSLKLDMYRRDFTMNTLAIKLNGRHYGTLIDYFGGQKDIKEGVIRVLHNLSFVEDPTRMLRAVRFEQRFGFKIGKLTLELLKNAARMEWAESLAKHRIFLELKLILKEKDPVKAIHRMHELNLLPIISRDLAFDQNLEDLLEEIKRVTAWYNLLFLEDPLRPWIVYWYGLTGRMTDRVYTRLAMSLYLNEIEKGNMVEERIQGTSLLEALESFHGSNHQLYKMLLPFQAETLLYLMAKSSRDAVRRLISLYFTQLKGVRIQLTGQDLMEMGLKPGPLFKRIFHRVIEARLNEKVRTLEDERRLVRQEFCGEAGEARSGPLEEYTSNPGPHRPEACAET